MSDVFGDMFLPSTLEEATANLLVKWFPTYLREFEDRLGLLNKSLREPTNYTNRNSFDAVAGEGLPKCVVISPGLSGTPTMNGSGRIKAPWRLGVGVAIAGTSEQEANMLSKVYGACVRAIILHHPSIDGIASDVQYTDETYDDIPVPDQLKQYRAANIWFVVEINSVVVKGAGPKDPAIITGVANNIIMDFNKIEV